MIRSSAVADRRPLLLQCPLWLMAYIAPFRALRYDPARAAVSDVVTQPYDKITPELQEHYHAASPYNLVRIILGKRETSDNETENTYSRAAGYFRDWRRQGIFLQDATPLHLFVCATVCRTGRKNRGRAAGIHRAGKDRRLLRRGGFPA